MASPAAEAASSLATSPAPIWGPAISIAALVAANIIALLLNPGLLRSCCWRAGRRKRDPAAAAAPAAPAPAPAPAPPRRVRCTPAPFFASNVSEEAAQCARARTPPLPREVWGFDLLSPRDPLSSYFAPRSARRRATPPSPPPLPQQQRQQGAGMAEAGEEEAWAPATWVLLPLNAFLFLYFLAYVLLETIWSIPMPGPPDHAYPQWLSYLTNWSITLLGAAGLLGLANTARCCRRQQHQQEQQERWDPLSVSHLLVAEVAVTAALFVTVFFWGSVFALSRGGGGGPAATSYLAHAGNSGAAVLILVATRLPIASPHFLALLWYASAYTIFAWIYGASSGGDWRYGLDWQKAGPAVAYALTPLFCFFVFFVFAFGLASLREAVGRRCVALGRRRRSGGGGGGGGA